MKIKKIERTIEILLVEDNKADIRLISEFFKDDNMISHNMNVVNNGIDALRYLRKEEPFSNSKTPDIVLMDLFMPKMDGFELLKTIRSDEKFLKLVIGVMTSNDSDIYRLNLDTENSSTFYVPKPVDVDKFLELMYKSELYLGSEMSNIYLNDEVKTYL